MANPTNPGAPPPASMAPTPGVTPGRLPEKIPDNGAPPDTRVGTIPGDTTLNPINEVRSMNRRPSMIGAPQGPDIAGHDPVLFTDIEGMYLTRLYPGHFADAGNAAADAAIEQGKRVQEQGRELIADQQSPINWEGEGMHRPSEGPGPGGEQAGRPWDEQEAQRRGREVRQQQEAQQHPHDPQPGQPGQPQHPPGETDEQRQQREQREKEERERQERERQQHGQQRNHRNIPPGREA